MRDEALAGRTRWTGLVGAGALVLATGALGVVTTPAPASAAACPLPGPLCFVAPDATTPVSIDGDPTVGSTLTATGPVWDQSGVTTTYQWRRDGSPIDGAVGSTYTTVDGDAGHDLTVLATGRNSAQRTGTSTSEAISVVTAPVADLITPPAVTGTPAVGELLTATTGTWRDPQPQLSLQWYRRLTGAFTAIDGATGETYTLRPGDAGATVAVVVSAAVDGTVRRAASSKPVVVDRLATTTGLRLVKRTVRPKHHATAVITLTSTAFTSPSGVVTVMDGDKRVARVTPKRGTARVRLRVLARGKHTLRATYTGGRAYAPSVSHKVTLTVR